jgi:hypothetical protein
MSNRKISLNPLGGVAAEREQNRGSVSRTR